MAPRFCDSVVLSHVLASQVTPSASGVFPEKFLLRKLLTNKGHLKLEVCFLKQIFDSTEFIECLHQRLGCAWGSSE